MKSKIWIAVPVFIAVLVVGIVAGLRFLVPSTIQLSETRTSQLVTWESGKLSGLFDISKILSASLDCDDGFANATVTLSFYSDGLLYFGLNLTAVMNGGHVENINATFRDDCLASYVRFFGLSDGSGEEMEANWKNLTLRAYNDFGRGSKVKAFISLDGLNDPKEVTSYLWLQWSVDSPRNQTEQLTLDVEVTYFNGTDHKKMIQPFQITLVADDNNSFETAHEIPVNRTIQDFIGFYDREDFFRVQLTKGEILNVTVDNAHGNLASENLSLSSSEDTRNALVAVNAYDYDYPLSIQCAAKSIGYWYIEVEYIGGGSDIYSVTVTTYT